MSSPFLHDLRTYSLDNYAEYLKTINFSKINILIEFEYISKMFGIIQNDIKLKENYIKLSKALKFPFFGFICWLIYKSGQNQIEYDTIIDIFKEYYDDNFIYYTIDNHNYNNIILYLLAFNAAEEEKIPVVKKILRYVNYMSVSNTLYVTQYNDFIVDGEFGVGVVKFAKFFFRIITNSIKFIKEIFKYMYMKFQKTMDGINYWVYETKQDWLDWIYNHNIFPLWKGIVWLFEKLWPFLKLVIFNSITMISINSIFAISGNYFPLHTYMDAIIATVNEIWPDQYLDLLTNIKVLSNTICQRKTSGDINSINAMNDAIAELKQIIKDSGYLLMITSTITEVFKLNNYYGNSLDVTLSEDSITNGYIRFLANIVSNGLALIFVLKTKSVSVLLLYVIYVMRKFYNLFSGKKDDGSTGSTENKENMFSQITGYIKYYFGIWWHTNLSETLKIMFNNFMKKTVYKIPSISFSFLFFGMPSKILKFILSLIVNYFGWTNWTLTKLIVYIEEIYNYLVLTTFEGFTSIFSSEILIIATTIIVCMYFISNMGYGEMSKSQIIYNLSIESMKSIITGDDFKVFNNRNADNENILFNLGVQDIVIKSKMYQYMSFPNVDLELFLVNLAFNFENIGNEEINFINILMYKLYSNRYLVESEGSGGSGGADGSVGFFDTYETTYKITKAVDAMDAVKDNTKRDNYRELMHVYNYIFNAGGMRTKYIKSDSDELISNPYKDASTSKYKIIYDKTIEYDIDDNRANTSREVYFLNKIGKSIPSRNSILEYFVDRTQSKISYKFIEQRLNYNNYNQKLPSTPKLMVLFHIDQYYIMPYADSIYTTLQNKCTLYHHSDPYLSIYCKVSKSFFNVSSKPTTLLIPGKDTVFFIPKSTSSLDEITGYQISDYIPKYLPFASTPDTQITPNEILDCVKLHLKICNCYFYDSSDGDKKEHNDNTIKYGDVLYRSSFEYCVCGTIHILNIFMLNTLKTPKILEDLINSKNTFQNIPMFFGTKMHENILVRLMSVIHALRIMFINSEEKYRKKDPKYIPYQDKNIKSKPTGDSLPIYNCLILWCRLTLKCIYEQFTNNDQYNFIVSNIGKDSSKDSERNLGKDSERDSSKDPKRNAGKDTGKDSDTFTVEPTVNKILIAASSVIGFLATDAKIKYDCDVYEKSIYLLDFFKYVTKLFYNCELYTNMDISNGSDNKHKDYIDLGTILKYHPEIYDFYYLSEKLKKKHFDYLNLNSSLVYNLSISFTEPLQIMSIFNNNFMIFNSYVSCYKGYDDKVGNIWQNKILERLRKPYFFGEDDTSPNNEKIKGKFLDVKKIYDDKFTTIKKTLDDIEKRYLNSIERYWSRPLKSADKVAIDAFKVSGKKFNERLTDLFTVIDMHEVAMYKFKSGKSSEKLPKIVNINLNNIASMETQLHKSILDSVNFLTSTEYISYKNFRNLFIYAIKTKHPNIDDFFKHIRCINDDFLNNIKHSNASDKDNQGVDEVIQNMYFTDKMLNIIMFIHLNGLFVDPTDSKITALFDPDNVCNYFKKTVTKLAQPYLMKGTAYILKSEGKKETTMYKFSKKLEDYNLGTIDLKIKLLYTINDLYFNQSNGITSGQDSISQQIIQNYLLKYSSVIIEEDIIQ